MTAELWGCILLGVLSIPVARQFVMHFAVMAAFNISLLGYTSADSTLLALLFGAVAIADMALASRYRSKSLALCAAVSTALCLEQMANQDFLLSFSTELSVATNAFIIIAIAREYVAWIYGKRPSY